MQLYLLRTEENDDGTFGELTISGDALKLYTLEEQWRNNEKGVSCIPAGSYLLKRTVYVKHSYETFEVTGVQHRSRILIHPGNTEEDTMGCILVGMRRGKVHVAFDEDTHAESVDKEGVVASQDAFRRFMRVMEKVDTATLDIEWAPGLP